MIVPPPPSRPGPVWLENTVWSRATRSTSACRVITQKPSPPGVCTVGSCHHTGAVRRSSANSGVREPVREQVEVGEIERSRSSDGAQPTAPV